MQLILCGSIVHSQKLPHLIPYLTTKGWGYSDSDGTLKIPPRFALANPFEDGIAVVSFDTTSQRSYCLIDEQGRHLFSPGWFWNGRRHPFRAGSELNVRDSAGRWGLVGYRGELWLAPQFDAPGRWPYSNRFNVVPGISSAFLLASHFFQ